MQGAQNMGLNGTGSLLRLSAVLSFFSWTASVLGGDQFGQVFCKCTQTSCLLVHLCVPAVFGPKVSVLDFPLHVYLTQNNATDMIKPSFHPRQ